VIDYFGQRRAKNMPPFRFFTPNANRNIYFRDGSIVRGEKIERPHQADRDLVPFSQAETVV
jgi:hypothetical protein